MIRIINGEFLVEDIYNLIVDLCDLCEQCWFHCPNDELRAGVFDVIRDWVETLTGIELKVSTIVEVLCLEERLEVVDGQVDFIWCGDEYELEGQFSIPSSPVAFGECSDSILLFDVEDCSCN